MITYNRPHHTSQLRISGLKWECAPIVVKLSTACSYFCTCIPAKVALWATGTSLMVQNTRFRARYVLRIDITALVWQLLTNILVVWYSFRGQPIQRRHFWLHGSNGRCYGNQILAKISNKLISQNGHNFSCRLCDMSMHVCFWDRISAISELVCSTPVQGKKDRYRGNQFRIKIAINVFIRDSVNMIRLLITEVFRRRPTQRHLGQDRPKKSHKMAITSVVCNVSIQRLASW